MDDNSLVSTGKVPPQAVDIEKCILGAVMLEKDAIAVVANVLRSEHFYVNAHRDIYSAALDLFESNCPIVFNGECGI